MTHDYETINKGLLLARMPIHVFELMFALQFIVNIKDKRERSLNNVIQVPQNSK